MHRVTSSSSPSTSSPSSGSLVFSRRAEIRTEYPLAGDIAPLSADVNLCRCGRDGPSDADALESECLSFERLCLDDDVINGAGARSFFLRAIEEPTWVDATRLCSLREIGSGETDRSLDDCRGYVAERVSLRS